MRVSKLIDELIKLKEIYGDLEVESGYNPFLEPLYIEVEDEKIIIGNG
jgi:hypothetical protein